jgi:hypothetical protein
MFSLGREPQVQDEEKKKSPGGATDFWLRREPQSSSPDICRRSAADGFREAWKPGAHAPGYPYFAAPRLDVFVPPNLFPDFPPLCLLRRREWCANY